MKITWKTNDSCLTKSRRREKFFWLPAINCILFCAIIISGIGYLICANDISIKGFVLSDLKIKLAEKQKEQEDLQITSLSMQAMEEIERRARELKMVKVDTIDYIDKGDMGVAKK
jgi:hypothetical protein